MPLILFLKKQDENLTSSFWLPSLRYVQLDFLEHFGHLELSSKNKSDKTGCHLQNAQSPKVCPTLKKNCNVGVGKSRSPTVA